MDKIHKFFECLIPITACNLRCEYCYVHQLSWDHGVIPGFDYPVEHMIAALSKDRLGGVCYFSICATGETTFCKQLPSFIAGLLRSGHYVNITTNGTFSRGIDEILRNVPSEYACHFHVAFSLHYKELKRLDLLDVFVKNVHKVHDCGCSYLIQVNFYDGYLPLLNEIKAFSIQNFGALPQLAATRLYGNGNMRSVKFHSSLSSEEYVSIGRQFDSPLFEFTVVNFNKRHREFCYAGAWSYVLNLKTGGLKSCYCNGREWDAFKDVTRKLPERPVGCHCDNYFCQNSSHMLSLGDIPNIFKDISYADLRDRPSASWYRPEMRAFLSTKLADTNRQLSAMGKIAVDFAYYKDKLLEIPRRAVRFAVRKLARS